MKHQIFVVMIALALFAAACSSAPSAVTQAPVLTEPVAVPTDPPTSPPTTEAPAEVETETIAPTAADPAVPAASSATPAAVGSSAGAVVYRIVPGESNVSYEVGETFLDQNRFGVAIGVTTEVNGEITLDSANPQATQVGEITVDISRLTSDSPRRDSAIRDRFLVSSQFPIATFVTTSIDGLPATYTEGQDVTFTMTGDLTIQQTTRPVTFDVTARVQDGALTGVAVSTIKMSDFGVGPINMAILRTEDDVKLTVNFVARP